MIPAQSIKTAQTTIPYPLASPVGGLNGRDPIAAMPPSDAYVMDNIIPRAAFCEARKGTTFFSTASLNAPVQTLDVYSGGGNPDVMLAWAGTKIYNVTTGTPVEIVSGMNSALAINAMFSNAADNAQFLISVTGVDTPKKFDGAAMSDLVLTGITDGTPEQLGFVFTFKGRLYFAQRGKLGFYYLPPGQIQGALEYFDLGAVSKLGGTLVSIASYSQAGETPDDYIVFITSNGECIVYSGSDPSSSTDWAIVGRFFSAPPIGANCALYYNNELTLLTQEGALPFSLIRERGQAKAQGVESGTDYAITSKLGKWFTDYTVYRNVPGWQAVQYPLAGLLVINVPGSNSIAGDFYHFVMNTTTRSWCRFTGWNGLCFTVLNGRLYYGRYDGYIMLADEGRNDAGNEIKVDCKQAYSYFADDRGAGPLAKHFQWATLTVSCDGAPPITGKLSVNFKETRPDYFTSIPDNVGSDWDTATWDQASWASGGTIRQVTITLNDQGYAASLWVRLALNNLDFQWYSTQFTFQKTAGLSPI